MGFNRINYPINSNIHQDEDDNSFAFFSSRIIGIGLGRDRYSCPSSKYQEVRRRDAVFTRRLCTVLNHP